MVSVACRNHIPLHLCGCLLYLLKSRPDDLNQKYCLRLTLYEEAVFALLNVIAGAVDDIVINQLHGGRMMFKHYDVCPDGILEAVEVGAEQPGLLFRHRHQVQLHGGGEGQRAFRTCQEPAYVYLFSVTGEGVRPQQCIEGITVVPAPQLRMRELPLYLLCISLIGENVAKISVYLCLKQPGVTVALCIELISG